MDKKYLLITAVPLVAATLVYEFGGFKSDRREAPVYAPKLRGCDFGAMCSTANSFCWSDPYDQQSGMLICDPASHTLRSLCSARSYCDPIQTPEFSHGCLTSSGARLTCDMKRKALIAQ